MTKKIRLDRSSNGASKGSDKPRIGVRSKNTRNAEPKALPEVKVIRHGLSDFFYTTDD